MVYDVSDGYVLLFGGCGGFSGSSCTNLLNDTWMFLSGKWTQLRPLASPPARWDSSMVYDSADRYVLLFGGLGRTGALGDTWRFQGGAWTNITGILSPPPRSGASLADVPYQYDVLFGGYTGSYLSDTWTFAGGSWTPDPTPTHPTGRSGAATVGLFGHGHSSGSLLFGGFNGSYLHDTWDFGAGGWNLLQDPSAPSARSGAGFAVVPSGRHAAQAPILFGGVGASGFLNDTWSEGSPDGSWAEEATIGPSARSMPGMAYDATDGYILLFGGLSPAGNVLGDSYDYVDNAWHLLIGGQPLYPVVFEANGLPPGASWTVHGNASSQTTTGARLIFELPNGTYPFRVNTTAPYAPRDPSLNVTVAGEQVQVQVYFSTEADGGYTVFFNETGLASDTSWTVVVGGVPIGYSSASLELLEPNGSYPFSVRPVPDYSATPASGFVAVDAATVTEHISFIPSVSNPPAPGGASSAPASPGTFFWLPGSQGYALFVGLVGLGVGAIALGVLVARRRGGEPPQRGPPRPPPAQAGPAPEEAAYGWPLDPISPELWPKNHR